MLQFTYTITDPMGLHARPAGLLVKVVKELDSAVTVAHHGKSASASKLMALMTLGAKRGDAVTVTVEGGHEEDTLRAMENFFRTHL